MKTDSFASRHIGISEEDIQVMLRKIGVATLDELIDKTIPAKYPPEGTVGITACHDGI